MTEPPVLGDMFAWRLTEKLEHFIKREVISTNTKLNKMQNLLNGYIWVKKTLGLYEWISFINKIVTRLESHTISPDVLDTELIIPFIRLLCSQYLRGNQWDRFKWEMKKLNTLLVSDSQISWHSISDTVKGVYQRHHTEESLVSIMTREGSDTEYHERRGHHIQDRYLSWVRKYPLLKNGNR